MKSFRLISMQIVSDEVEPIDIGFKEGLIINKEDERGTWLIEVFAADKYTHHFEKARSDNEDMVVQVIITKKENDPAAFKVKVCSINKVNGYASILLKGHLTKIQNDYPAMILEYLLDQGISGETLLIEFKKMIIARPKVIPPKKG